MSIHLPLTGFEFVDDGMYQCQWNVYEADGRVFAHAFSQKAAEEIFFAVNYLRGQLTAAEEARR